MRHNGSRKYSPEGRSDANVHELQSALAKMKNTKPQVQRCLTCEHGINVNLGRKHTFDCRQTILPSLVPDSLWTVEFDADGKVLKRHEHGDDVEHRDSKRVRYTHKLTKVQTWSGPMTQLRNVRNCLTHHHPVLQVTRLRRICMIHLLKSGTLRRVKALWRNLGWMLIWKSVPLRRPQTPSWKLIEHWTQQTRRFIACWKKFHLSLRQVTNAAEHNSIRDKRVHNEVYESEADAKIKSGKWVLRPHKARYVLRVWEARSRPGCQGPQRSCTGDLSTTSWKMKLTGRRKNRVIREKEDEEEEVNGDVEAIRGTHNAHETWM